jgi:hypothetical protein
MTEPTSLNAARDDDYAEALLRDLIAMGVEPAHLIDCAVDVAADELELNEPVVVKGVRAALAAELARRQR